MKVLIFPAFIALFVLSQLKINAQNVTLSCPSNIVANTDNGKEGTTVTFPALAPESGTATYTPASGSFFRLGSHSIILTTSTGQKCSFTVTVTDNQSPSLSPITLSRTQIWPASNRMKRVAVYYDASDNGKNVKTTIAVSSNATDGIRDWEIVDDHLLRLKSSRLADGSVRIYTITVVATDETGNKTTRTTSIAVSKTMTAVAVN